MLSKEYALAFYQYGNDLGKVGSLEKEFGLLVESINKEPDFKKMIAHPKLTTSEKKEIISKIMSSFDEDLQNFCFVLVDNGRFVHLEEIYEQFVALIKKEQTVMIVTATSSEKLSDKHIASLTNELKLKYDKKIEIVAIVDENVLGGVRLEFNGKVLDGTLKTSLDDLKSNLI
jgi:F-type H+-transporting ATPase subunit delta